MLPALMLVATLVAIGLMIAVVYRMGIRLQTLQDDFDRLKVVQRDMSTDVRARLDEGSKTWESVETEVRPKLQQLEALEPSVADLSAALEENLPALSDARKRLEAVEQRTENTESRVTAALEASTTDAGERFDRVEEAVRTLRNAADERLADVAGRVEALEEAATAAPAEPVFAAVGAVEEADASTPEPREERGSRPPPVPGEREGGRRRKGAGHWVLIVLAVAIGVVALVAALDS